MTNIGSSIVNPRKEWYLRKDADEEWYGPFSYYVANRQARVATRDGDDLNVKYMQIGTYVGRRAGDPKHTPERIEVVYIYANGRAFAGGRVAKFNAEKLPL